MRLSEPSPLPVRLSIRYKLFAALLFATALVVAAMYGFMRWSFQHGFVRFLESRQQARVERMVERLAGIYETEGGWDGLLGDRRRWRYLLDGSRGDMPPGPGMPHVHGRGPGPGPGGEGLVLLDADRVVLFGPPGRTDGLSLSPVRVAGRTVGYVGRPSGRALSDMVDVQFAEAQKRAFVWIALLVGGVATALSWPLANMLVRPLRRVTEATRALAAGRFQSRVAVASNDELGDLARDFNDMAQTLERTDTARREWMADISHELRTPLALLRAELEALQDGVRPLEPAAVVSLQGDVLRLSRVVEDLYQLAMTDLGTMSYRKREVDPVALLEDDVEAVSGEFARKGIGLELRGLAGRSVTLHGDPDRLSQLFRNLLQNSLRYTDPGGRLEIEAGHDGGRLTLDFQDSAPAVSPEALPRLFERFYRTEASRSRETGGAGLGLAICRNIVEAHDGRIEARPSRLGGLCIHVELPGAS